MRYDCIPIKLADLFSQYGRFIARHPLPFVVIPPLLSCVLMLGLLNINVKEDVEYVYSTMDAPAKQERQYFADNFLSDENMYFRRERRLFNKGYLTVYIEHSNGAINVIEDYKVNDDVLLATKELNEHIISRKTNGDAGIAYVDVCSKWIGECLYNDYLELFGLNESNQTSLTYPYYVAPSGITYALDSYFGDVKVDTNRSAISVHSFMLVYFVRFHGETDEKRSNEWLNDQRDFLLDYDDPRIDICLLTSLTVAQELAALINTVAPLLAIMIVAIALFAILCSMTGSWVRSKPFVAISGLLAAIFGVMSAMGFMTAVGVPFVATIGSMPFLIIGK